jgi:glucan endo-1,3-alpha-glucosidase
MIGSITPEHTNQDIIDAKNLGLDAFALNLGMPLPLTSPVTHTDFFADSMDGWATDTVNHLFDQADASSFGLFFSFDHNHFTSPTEYTEYLKPFLTRPSYFKYNAKPLVSTFNGEAISNDDWASFKSAVGDVLLIPGFSNAVPSPDFFSTRSALDGVFNWNSWPAAASGKVDVSDVDDTTYLSAAHSQSKLFIMGVSPLQFKHIDAGNNWYLRGEGNLEVRLGQALALQPDMIELQTWNDAGESHYMGNWWEDPIGGTPILDYVRDYDHKGYWNILGPFIQAWKRGDTTMAGMVPVGKDVQGAFWHHTLTVNADCGADGFGKPRDFANAEDVVSGVVLVAAGKTGLVAVVNNGDKELGRTEALVEGFNKFRVEGLGDGQVSVKIVDGSGAVVTEATGPLSVSSSAALCNYNFQVVGI